MILSAFTHLWNPIGFPYGPSNDEGIYIRRALNVLDGQGPQESLLYDHPYLTQLFLTGALSIIGYPDSLHLSITWRSTLNRNGLACSRNLMGLLAVVDTFLVYKIAELRYSNNRTIALIASILFAVTPFTAIMRRVRLESIQLPLLLCSILFALYSKKSSSEEEDKSVDENKDKDKEKNKNKQQIVLILLSGIFLELAIFTKILYLL